MSIYSEFASVYDVMQYDVDYERWIEEIKNRVTNHNTSARTMLELACGTGTIGIGLSKKGFNVEALDISEDMLTVAQAKAYENNVKMKFYHQDMVSFNTKKRYDAVFCMCDGMNYVLKSSDLSKVFENIYKHLNENGILIFDISSYYKLKHVVGNHTFAETFDHEAYIWENQFDDATKMLEFSLTLFKEEENGYERYEELHTQHAYEIPEILAITNTYFDIIDILDGDTFETNQETSNRICFIMKKR